METPLGSPPGTQIKEEEWENRRDVLIQLYLENDAKLKDIVQVLAEENFVVTERQLKYRFFQKWNVKKNIKSRDLPMLSSAIDERRKVGQDVRIEYHGRDIGPERIERASKRCKTLSPPPSQDLSSPLGATPLIDQRFALASETPGGEETDFDTSSQASRTVTPFPGIYSAGGELQTGNDNAEDAVCEMEGILPNDERVSGVDSLKSKSNAKDSTQIPTRTSHIELVSQYAGLVVAHSTEAMDVDVNWSTDVDVPTVSNAALPRSRLDCADWAWTMSPEYGPNIQQNGDDTIANMLEHMDLQPLSESPMLIMAPLQFPYSSGIPSIPPNMLMHGLQVDAVAADGTSLETTIPSVENFLTRLLVFRCGSVSFDILRSSWEIGLTLEIDDWLRWIVSSCQRAVAQGQVDKETFDGQALLSIPVHQRNTHDRPFSANRTSTRGETLMEAPEFRALKTFAMEFSIAGSGRYPVGSDVITVCSIPNHPQRTRGLMVSFALNTPPFGSRISPHITTFTVVPFGSSIIRCIEENDLEGVRKLFAERQASPLDVDPRGVSLLQYAMLGGDSPVFRFLLRWGAGVQTFRYSDYTADFVWMLWTHYVNHVRIPGAPRIGPNNRIEDFDKCTHMTNAILESGYDVDAGLFNHPSRPNLLFELACDGGHAWQKRSTIVEALQYLARKGYDLEEENWEGDTPLLYATKAHRAGAVTHIEAFVEAGSDTSATNLAGQGPLHCALSVPDSVSPADWNIQEKDNSFFPSPSFYEYRIKYSTFHEGPEGYRCNADHICWRDTNGVSRRMRNPIQVLKERSKFKILVLLQAGCDPNLPDIAGETPHQYAERNGLFPQWQWALIESGFMLEEKSGQWVK